MRTKTSKMSKGNMTLLKNHVKNKYKRFFSLLLVFHLRPNDHTQIELSLNVPIEFSDKILIKSVS